MEKLTVFFCLIFSGCSPTPEPTKTPLYKKLLNDQVRRELSQAGQKIIIVGTRSRLIIDVETAFELTSWEAKPNGEFQNRKTHPLCAGRACGVGEVINAGEENSEDKIYMFGRWEPIWFLWKERPRNHPDITTEQKKLDELIASIPALP